MTAAREHDALHHLVDRSPRDRFPSSTAPCATVTSSVRNTSTSASGRKVTHHTASRGREWTTQMFSDLTRPARGRVDEDLAADAVSAFRLRPA